MAPADPLRSFTWHVDKSSTPRKRTSLNAPKRGISIARCVDDNHFMPATKLGSADDGFALYITLIKKMRILTIPLLALVISAASGCTTPSSPQVAPVKVAVTATPTSPSPEPQKRRVEPMTRQALMLIGARSYQEFCAACHQQSGSGVSSARISSLHQSSVVNDTNQKYLRFVMFNEPKMEHAAWYLAMSPAALASALTYIRVQFPNTNQELVQPIEVIAELAKSVVTVPSVK